MRKEGNSMDLSNLVQNTFLLVGMIVCSFYITLYYIVHAIFLYKTAKRYDVKGKFLSWVPVVNLFYTGAIAEKIYPLQRFVSQMFGAFIAGGALIFVGSVLQTHWVLLLTWIPAIFFMVFYYMGFYRIYCAVDERNGTVLFLLCLFFSLARVITRIYLIFYKLNTYKKRIEHTYYI